MEGFSGMLMKNLHLTPLGANVTEVRYGDNYVLFSYQTPVAYMDVSGTCFQTNEKFSVTTSKHISKWLNGRFAAKVNQDQIENLVK
jgi:hypothetical protein